MSERGQRHVGSEARRLLSGLDRRGDLERARAVSAWQEIAGPEVSEHAMGYAMRGNELVVYTDSPVWASELSALSERYRTAVNEHLGREMVGSIRFTVSRGVHRAGEEGGDSGAEAAAEVEPEPLDETETASLERLAEGIHDERLRDAALGAARRHLEWRKGLRKRGRA